MAYPSTFLDLQDAVLAKGRLDPTADRAKVKDWINQALANICLEAEALVNFATMTTTANAVSYTLSAPAVRIKGMYVTSGGIQYKPLEPISLERMLELRQGSPASSAGGSLRYYCLVGLSQFELYPTPTGHETITIYYVAQPTVLSGDTDVPDIPEPFASGLIEAGALVEAYEFKRDDQQQGALQRYELQLQRFRAHLSRKKGGVPEQMLVYGSYGSQPHDPSTDVG